MCDNPRYSHPIRPDRLPERAATPFELTPDAAARAAIAEALDLSALRKLRFAGTLAPLGARDWELTADLGATVVQPCVVTFEPVTTRIDETVARRYLADPLPLPEGDEIEMPEDDSVEALPETIDLGAVMIEALSLALPLYPHAEGAAPVEISVTEPGKQALSDDDTKPFAGLAALRDKMGEEDRDPD